MTEYQIVTFHPNVAMKSPIIMGFSNGDEKRKVKIGPNPALALKSPRSMGIVEQLQNGVMAPRAAARK